MDIFPKRLVHGFGPKLAIFAHITRDMCFHVGGTHITRDKCFPCKKTPITRPVLQLLSGNIGQENMFHDILERKNNVLGYKKKFKKSKN